MFIPYKLTSLNKLHNDGLLVKPQKVHVQFFSVMVTTYLLGRSFDLRCSLDLLCRSTTSYVFSDLC